MYLSQQYQGSVLWNSTQRFFGEYHQLRSKAFRYFFLDDINRSVMRSYLSTLRCNSKNPSKVYPKQKYSLDTALIYEYSLSEVVDLTRQFQNNYLTLSGGKKDGIMKDMGVFCPTGIVGIVIDVSDHYALAMSVLHTKFKVNCELKKSGIYGMLQWDGSSPYYAELTDLPNHARAVRGDTVITGKLSGVFPYGIPVGTIEYVERRHNDPFLTARIRLSTEWGNIHQVFLVKNTRKSEADSLKKKIFQLNPEEE